MGEIWKLVDYNEEKTGVIIKRGTGTPIPRGMYHRAVDIWVKDAQGLFLIQQRHPDKKWGLEWECQGGALISDESTAQCAVRELEEETGIRVPIDRIRYLGKNFYENVRCVMYSYMVEMDEPADQIEVHPQKREVVDAKWVTLEELEEMRLQIVDHLWERYLLYKDKLIEGTKFRPIRRTKRALTEEAAKQLLSQGKRGVLAVNGELGYPFAFPINYYYEKEENRIYFHGAKSGHKVDALKRDDRVCFTLYGNDHFEEPGKTPDWAPYVQSVVVYGRCRLIVDEEEKAKRIRTLALKYYPSAQEVEEEMARDIYGAQLYEITIEHMTGKQIHEK